MKMKMSMSMKEDKRKEEGGRRMKLRAEGNAGDI